MAEEKISPLAMLVFDDARKEVSGKDILIGLYSGGIRLHKLPANLLLQSLLIFEIKKIGDVKLNIHFKGPNIDQGFELEMGFNELSKPHQPATMMLPRLPFTINNTGELTVEMQQDGGPWSTLRVIPISYEPKPNPQDAPNVPAPPPSQ